MDHAELSLRVCETAEYPCSYYDGRQARSQLIAPGELVTTSVAEVLLEKGFRRSGLTIYRPVCGDCRTCVPTRINVFDFQPSRSQKRNWRTWSARLRTRIIPPIFVPRHFALYQTYQAVRHPDGGMENYTREHYQRYLLASAINTRLVEFLLGDVLKAVSIIDLQQNAISSVYTFYDPHDDNAGYGIYSLLWQLAYGLETQKRYVYLGYWLKDHPKMDYKKSFRPLEKYQNGQWSSDILG